MKHDTVYIDQMNDSIGKIELFVVDFDKDAFFADAKTQSAVIMQLALIGELSKKITDETKAKTNLPWKDIAGFRDRAIHNYFDIDLRVVWDTVTTDLPLLKQELQKIT